MIIKDNMANMCAKVTSTYMEFTLAFGPKPEFSFSFEFFYCIWNYSVLLKLDYLCRKNRTMFLKILILDVHRQKNFGNLKGSTPKEQYDYYEKKYLNNATYIKSLLQEYPELKRLLE